MCAAASGPRARLVRPPVAFSARGGDALQSPGVAVAQTANRSSSKETGGSRPTTIRSYFHLGPGGRLDSAKIDQALKSLYATGLFQDVRINHVGGRMIVTVVENPVINRVAFEGNKKIKDDQLKTEVQSKARGTLSQPAVQADVQRIIEIYQRNGRFDVQVDAEDHRAAEQSRESRLRDQGRPKDRRQERSDLSAPRLLAKAGSRTTSRPAKHWSRLPADHRHLRSGSGRGRPRSDAPVLSQHGYADVRIVSAVGEYDPARKGFLITFTIDEGRALSHRHSRYRCRTCGRSTATRCAAA